MSVTVGRVSQIEHGEPASVDVLDPDVSAPSAKDLQIVADVVDEQIM